ncbi:hypothetical protein EG68_08043 [Paragonimus skrjabini miyazakii]|uniref:Uncharacterized protein n=1 Tax=Paragonimus skrjabini miyazakii TaxID=59628 RepID=A0A8S9YK75_9TREM|nr:hypothetical protein EG68_08043 [Paragonimus skrjabini miyazakii]
MTGNQIRLTYLSHFCNGLAVTAIQHFTVLDADGGYVLAGIIPEKRFGENFVVTRFFMDELLDGSRLSPGNSTALGYLAQQMRVCEVTLTQLKYDSDLNTSGTNEIIVKWLPSHLRVK